MSPEQELLWGLWVKPAKTPSMADDPKVCSVPKIQGLLLLNIRTLNQELNLNLSKA